MVAHGKHDHRSSSPALSAGPGTTDDPWLALLEDLRARMLELEQRSRRAVEWTIFRWSGERLPSAAIRIDGSEGLTGPAPARWRIVTQIDAETGALALAVLDGRAPLQAQNVIASMLASSDGEFVIASREAGQRRWPLDTGEPGEPLTEWLRDGIDRLVDLVLGRDTPPPEGAIAHPLALALALAPMLSR